MSLAVVGAIIAGFLFVGLFALFFDGGPGDGSAA